MRHFVEAIANIKHSVDPYSKYQLVYGVILDGIRAVQTFTKWLTKGINQCVDRPSFLYYEMVKSNLAPKP